MYRMKNSAEILLGVILVFILIGEPHFMETFANSLLGKLFFIILIVVTALHSVVAGVLMFVIFIVLRNDINIREGMENNGDSNDTESDSESDSESESATDKTDNDEDESDTDDEDEDDDEDTSSSNGSTSSSSSNGSTSSSNGSASTSNGSASTSNGKAAAIENMCRVHGFVTAEEAMRPQDSKSVPTPAN